MSRLGTLSSSVQRRVLLNLCVMKVDTRDVVSFGVPLKRGDFFAVHLFTDRVILESMERQFPTRSIPIDTVQLFRLGDKFLVCYHKPNGQRNNWLMARLIPGMNEFDGLKQMAKAVDEVMYVHQQLRKNFRTSLLSYSGKSWVPACDIFDNFQDAMAFNKQQSHRECAEQCSCIFPSQKHEELEVNVMNPVTCDLCGQVASLHLDEGVREVGMSSLILDQSTLMQ